MKRNCQAAFLATLLLLACREIPTKKGSPAHKKYDACKPSFLKISEEPISVEAGTWTVFFSVTLIGCKRDLEVLTSEELSMITTDLENSDTLPIFRFYYDATKPEVRNMVKARINATLGRSVITDILIHGVDEMDDLGGLTH